jgi:hypothetical protein
MMPDFDMSLTKGESTLFTATHLRRKKKRCKKPLNMPNVLEPDYSYWQQWLADQENREPPILDELAALKNNGLSPLLYTHHGDSLLRLDV